MLSFLTSSTQEPHTENYQHQKHFSNLVYYESEIGAAIQFYKFLRIFFLLLLAVLNIRNTRDASKSIQIHAESTAGFEQ